MFILNRRLRSQSSLNQRLWIFAPFGDGKLKGDGKKGTLSKT